MWTHWDNPVGLIEPDDPRINKAITDVDDLIGYCDNICDPDQQSIQDAQEGLRVLKTEIESLKEQVSILRQIRRYKIIREAGYKLNTKETL